MTKGKNIEEPGRIAESSYCLTRHFAADRSQRTVVAPEGSSETTCILTKSNPVALLDSSLAKTLSLREAGQSHRQSSRFPKSSPLTASLCGI